MSRLIVEVSTVDRVEKHPNADRLSVCKIKGWDVVTGLDQYKPGDKVIYVPVDAVLPPELDQKLFANSKIKSDNGRIRASRIRGLVSYGFTINPDDVGLGNTKVGTDVAEQLGITKYEPPPEKVSGQYHKLRIRKSRVSDNPYFEKYTDLDNIKNFPYVFEEGELVYISEKLHGTSARAGVLPTQVDTLWKKVKRFFGLLKPYEFVYGSRNVQLQNGGNLFYAQDVYAQAVRLYNLDKVLKPGEVLYGEIVGHGIQKGYDYGFPEGKIGFFAYDLMRDGRYVDFEEFREWCVGNNIPTVPIIDICGYSDEVVRKHTTGPSILHPAHKVREGSVVKSYTEQFHPEVGRKVLKSISPEYLLNKDNTDWH